MTRWLGVPVELVGRLKQGQPGSGLQLGLEQQQGEQVHKVMAEPSQTRTLIARYQLHLYNTNTVDVLFFQT